MPKREIAPFSPRPFHPAWWLPGPHAQTLAGRFLRPAGHDVEYRRERLQTPDGDFLDLDFAERIEGIPLPGDDAPVGLILHGLEGSSQSSYVIETCRAVAAVGMRPIALNFRTCSGEMNRTARFYHSGETGDVAFVLDWLEGRFSGAPRVAVGYSLGGNVLLKYLGERGEEAKVCAAAAVSVPYDLAAGGRKLERSFMGRLYTRVFLRSLVGKYRAKRELIGGVYDAGRVARARTFREFDDAATAPIHGFRDADHYYSASSSQNFLEQIRVPTLLVHAADDPFVARASIPHGAVRSNPCLYAAFGDRGGHVGFIGGAPGRPVFWAEREVARFLALQLAG